MAFIIRSGSGYVVRQGNNNRLLGRFRGADAKRNAEREVARLHRRNMPATRNRGARARNRFD